MLVRPTGQFITQRTHPQLSQIKVALTSDHLEVTVPGADTMKLDLSPPDAPEAADALKPVKLFGKSAWGWPVKGKANQILSDYLGTPVELVRSSFLSPRTKPSKVDGRELPIDFADGYPLLLVNAESVAHIQRAIGENFGPERFRANIIVEGLPPFAEENAISFTSEGLCLLAEKICTRCTMVNVNPQDSSTQSKVLSYLKKEKPSPKGPLFGLNLSVKQPGFLKAGQELMVKSL